MPPLTTRDVSLFLALYLFNCIVYSSWLDLGQVAARPVLLLVWLYGLVGLVPLAWRDEAPVAVFATQWVLALAAWPFMSHYVPIVGIVVALYAVSVHRGRGVSLVALLTSCVPIGLELAATVSATRPGHALFEVVFTDAALLVGAVCWAWGFGRVTQATERRVRDLERERESAREAEVLAAERRRIARELHDIVSHAVTVIVLQAAGAARVGKSDFAQVIRSLGHIETTGKQAMGELRRLLGVLEDSTPDDQPTASGVLKPQPGLADLPELLASLRETGMFVTVEVEGTPAGLDSGLDLTAYRIVQEGLINVAKHAGKNADPRLRLVWGAQGLLIQIDNTITRTPRAQPLPGGGGRGLIGLRERAHAAGGNLHAGPHEGGYRLTATIPLVTPVSAGAPASRWGRGQQGKVSV